MIEADKEINNHVIRLQTDINEIQIKIKLRKIMIPISYLLMFIYFLCLYQTNDNMLFIDLIGIITGYFIYIYTTALIKELCDFENEIAEKEKEIEETKKFSTYLLACRQIEAKEHGQDIYPEVRYGDSLCVKEEFKDKFEEKRIEYEQRHLGRLKLNPYYLDEKLAKAPINTYPIHEQDLLYAYQKNKTAFLKERERILKGKS